MDHETVMAYLNRVGVTAPTVSNAAGLRTLHRAHQLAVPFENLSIHLAEPISLDERDLIDKIVRRRRGGFCYELNGAFALLLEALGARVNRVAARVYGEAGVGPPFDHLALIVHPADGSGPMARRRGLRQSQRLSAAAGGQGGPGRSGRPVPARRRRRRRHRRPEGRQAPVPYRDARAVAR